MELNKKIDEELRLKFLKLYEDFSKKSTPEELKYIASQIRPDLIKNGNSSFSKNYEFGNYRFNLNIDYTKGSKQPYFSDIYFTELFRDPEEHVNIPVKIIDEEIDINYLLSIITHEIRHIYDIFNIANEYEVVDFYKKMKIQIFKNTPYETFTHYIYLSLEHELIARHNMLYPLYRWLEVTDKNKLYQLYSETYSYKSLIQLENFNHTNFIAQFNDENLIFYTNEFIKNIANENNFCKNKEDLINYYKKWSDFFKEKSKEYLNYIDDMLNDIIQDIQNDKTFENKTWEYNEYNINGAYKIFKEFYKEIFQ